MKYTNQYIEDIRKTWNVISETCNIRNTKMLITGCTGLIGSALVDTLLWANRNTGLGIKLFLGGRNEKSIYDRFKEYRAGEEYQFVYYDLNEPIHVEKVDYIIHLAGIANTTWYAERPVETIYTTIIGIKNILELAKSFNDCRLLYVSSSEVYGSRNVNEPYTESDYGSIDVLNPRSCYPSGKRVAETLCAAYKSEYDIDFVTARPGHVYGPTVKKGDFRASSLFPFEAAMGKSIVMKSAGQQQRSHCYVFDVVSALIFVLIKGVSGEAYNISNKDSVSTIRQFADEISKAGEVELRFEEASYVERKGYNMMRNSVLDATKLERLGWHGLFDLETGAKHTVDILRVQI